MQFKGLQQNSYPHDISCRCCRERRVCNGCGSPVTQSSRCVNGRCKSCCRKRCNHDNREHENLRIAGPQIPEKQTLFLSPNDVLFTLDDLLQMGLIERVAVPGEKEPGYRPTPKGVAALAAQGES